MLSDLEQQFEFLLKVYKIEGFERELRFSTKRLFRFDFAWPKQKVAVEMEGGIWGHGGHSTSKGILRDIEKHNLSLLEGWRVLRYTRDHLKNPDRVIGELQQLLGE